MKTGLNRPRHSALRRTAIPIVIIFMIGSSIVLGSVLRFAVSETRLNRNSEMWMEAKFAAEAVSEYGFAELRKRFDSNNSFPEYGLLPIAGGNPLTLPAQFYSFFSNTGSQAVRSNLVLPANPYDPFNEWGTYDTELFAGIVPAGQWVYIDPAIPGNETDKLKGRRVFSRGIAVFGKATVLDPKTQRRFVAYNRQELHVRDAPLFSHAIFYNMDMEIAPGQDMTIVGPVHVNGDLFVQSGASVSFLGQVTAAGSVYHGRHPDSGQSVSNGHVNFLNGTSATATSSMRDSTGWIDSNRSNFADTASEIWRGNLMSDEHHVEGKPLVDIEDYVADDPSTTDVNDALNYGYELISRARASDDPAYSTETEQQKFSYKAGLTVRIDPGTSTYQLVSYQRDTNGDVVYDGVTKRPVEIIIDDSSAPIAEVKPFSSTGGGSSEVVTGGLRDARRGNRSIDLVEIDVGLLRTKVHNNDEADWGGASNQRPENWWNGVVFVEFPDGTPATRPDSIQPSVGDWGVKLKNGEDIPNPAFGFSHGIYGTTFATNNVMYLQGHYNSDGLSSTGSATDPDASGISNEPPAALAADAVVILSSNWDSADSGKHRSDRNGAFTEVSAAILGGVVPSGKTGGSSYSGGVENFPRLLEHWSSHELRIRGSFVSLYESELATEAWSYGGNIYTAPMRNWGFNSNFAQGYYPPGTPNVRAYRRIDFRDLSQPEYVAEVAYLKSLIP